VYHSSGPVVRKGAPNHHFNRTTSAPPPDWRANPRVADQRSAPVDTSVRRW